MSELTKSLTAIATAIIGLAILSVIVSKQANTSAVIGAAAQGLATDIGAAVSPVTGGGSSNIGGGINSGLTMPTFFG
jgi:hypothetical protein